MSQFTESLQGRGFIQYFRPELISMKAKSLRVWQRFCELPIELKKSFEYDNQGNMDGAGYEYKTQIGNTLDLKENFHFTMGGLYRITEFLDKITVLHDHVQVKQFIDQSIALVNLVEQDVFNITQLIQRDLKIQHFGYEVINGRNHWILRYLHYFPDQPVGSVLASPHPDKSGLTFYLGETAPGIQYLTKDKQWVNLSTDEDMVTVTPNLQLQYKTHGEVKALYHRVVANEQSMMNGRYSIVLFVPFMHTPQYNKLQNGRTQDFPVGWNYDMPFEDFAKLFI